MESDVSEIAKLPYHIHWHVLITHFPISFFVAAFGFQIAHFFTMPRCFEESSNLALIAGTAALMPAILTGWKSWKSNYSGAQVPIFQRKIIISFIMLGLSFVLSVWRITFMDVFEDIPTNLNHWIYFSGNLLLMAGASTEGYYGGRLNHR